MPRLIEEAPEARLAIPFDILTTLDAVSRTKMFGPKLERLDVNGRIEIDGLAALVFTCPIKQAALIIDLGRGWDREAGRKPLPCWVDRGDGWKKVPAKAVLTLPIDGTIHLHPDIFGGQIEAPGLKAESIL